MKRRKSCLSLFENFALLSIALVAVVKSEPPPEWSYNEKGKGPSDWYKKSEACGAKRQSPIALWKNDIVVDTTVPILNLENYHVEFKDLKLENNGHTSEMRELFVVLIKIEIPNSKVTISGGGLPGKYNFAQMHFHWGKTDNQGSEHMIGNKFFPAEVISNMTDICVLSLHLVHIRDGLTLDEALKDPQGLAVLGVFYDYNDVVNNTSLMPIIEEIDLVEDPKSFVIMKSPLKLQQLLPQDTSNFFTYNGSLTTPPCNEVVIWSIFTQPFFITTSQLEKFRSIKVHNVDENMTDEKDIGQKLLFNHRMPQPLHGRTVLVRKELILELPTKGAKKLIMNANFLFCVIGSLLYQQLVKYFL